MPANEEPARCPGLRTRVDDGDLDAVVAQHLEGGHGEAQQRVLGGHVRALLGIGRHRRHGAGVDDGTPLPVKVHETQRTPSSAQRLPSLRKDARRAEVRDRIVAVSGQ